MFVYAGLPTIAIGKVCFYSALNFLQKIECREIQFYLDSMLLKDLRK